VITGENERRARESDLDGLPIFDGIGDGERAWVAAHGRVVEFAEGVTIVEEDAPADDMIVVLTGAAEFDFSMGPQHQIFRRFGPGDVTGVLPYSRMTKVPGTAVAVEDSSVLLIHRNDFAELVKVAPTLGQRLVAILSDRVRDATRNQDQHEKMVALGKLSAGLAHELNNPASAARSSTAALRERLHRLPGLVTRLTACGITHEQICAVNALREAAEAGRHPPADALERSDRELEIARWLERYKVPDAYVMAETLVEAGVTVPDLQSMASSVPPHVVRDAVAWVEGSLAADKLLGEIEDAAGRISSLVASVKTYSHMDRGTDAQPTDIRQGIDSTLTMLGHKLHRKSIRVERVYAADLPEILAYAGELNQVWTNLIDNAIDALPEGGELRIEAAPTNGHVEVRVLDNGHGIPAELTSRIFEPFFTTKDVGDGTGLGLEIARRIIATQHGGSIDVESEPGRTVFTVCLPLEAPRYRARDEEQVAVPSTTTR
jgi:signal transduction histidine kinase